MQAIRLGVGGILLKATAPRMIADCVRKVHAGGRWLDRDTLMQAIDTMVRRDTGLREATSVLTPRELEVVGMIVQGMRNKEIAARLCVSEGTIKTHLHNVYHKLKLSGRVELILLRPGNGLGLAGSVWRVFPGSRQPSARLPNPERRLARCRVLLQRRLERAQRGRYQPRPRNTTPTL